MADYTRANPTTPQIRQASIQSIDTQNQGAYGWIDGNRQVYIDTSYYVGATSVTPTVGDQWQIQKINGQWRLHSRLPANDPNQAAVVPTAGQHIVGSGQGPVELQGTQINANAPLALQSYTTAGLPDPPPAGSVVWNSTTSQLNVFDGTSWAAPGSGGYTKPVGGIPSTDMTAAVQTALGLASSAYQKPGGGIPSTDLASSVQTALGLANTALQGVPSASVGLTQLSATGTHSSTTFLRGDNTWATIGAGVDQAYADGNLKSYATQENIVLTAGLDYFADWSLEIGAAYTLEIPATSSLEIRDVTVPQSGGPLVGSGFVAYRAAIGAASVTAASPSSVTLGSGIAYSLFVYNASCFDTVQYQTTDLAYNGTTNTITVGVAGWYKVDVGIEAFGSGSVALGVCLFRNGTLWKLGAAQLEGSGNSPPISSSFTIPCAAQDTLTPGCFFNGAGFTGPYGDSGGVGTYWSVSLMNCGIS